MLLSIAAALLSLMCIALILHELSHGRMWFAIALYGQTFEHLPHSTHFVLSIKAR